jgi:hypothetical protein
VTARDEIKSIQQGQRLLNNERSIRISVLPYARSLADIELGTNPSTVDRSELVERKTMSAKKFPIEVKYEITDKNGYPIVSSETPKGVTRRMENWLRHGSRLIHSMSPRPYKLVRVTKRVLAEL